MTGGLVVLTALMGVGIFGVATFMWWSGLVVNEIFWDLWLLPFGLLVRVGGRTENCFGPEHE